MQEKNIVLFDMDNTLVSANTGELWTTFLDQKGILSPQDKKIFQEIHALYSEGKLDPNTGYEHLLSIMQKIPHHEKELWVEEFFHGMVKHKTSVKGLNLIKNHQEEPDTLVILITASLSFVVSHVANHSGVHGFIATEGEILEGKYTGKLSGVPCLGEGKIARFEQWSQENQIIPAHTTLYTDSINDLPLLNYVKKPIVVDPDKYLKQVALEKNWDILSFLETEDVSS